MNKLNFVFETFKGKVFKRRNTIGNRTISVLSGQKPENLSVFTALSSSPKLPRMFL